MRIGCFVEKYNFHTKDETLALERFKSAAEAMGHGFEFIFKKDLNRLQDFDSIFIRANTDPMNTAYVVSRMADSMGKVVIDDPHSIRICSSKVVLDGLFKQNGIPSPKSLLFEGDYHPERLRSISGYLGYPIVVKAPYTKFSSHVEKAHDETEFREVTARYLKNATPIVLQEFMPTSFDWRVGMLDNKVLYLCKYMMPRGGWKVKSIVNGRHVWGDTVPIFRKNIPRKLEELAVRVSKCVGDGLYGLDIKEVDGEYYCIEINDNPSFYGGLEDAKDRDIYEKIIERLVSGRPVKPGTYRIGPEAAASGAGRGRAAGC
ncbi:ATP-grasp domain-containing protein [Methanocella arvoryzae]|uniref:30S ribosomal protein S6 modification protein n=1 Tax=Methanocella arvoryzae (strain DSM 22066 / NBRC 105507 / MRE50) TaxID=351160 RepID=Q0W5G4_METAR|nr:RimK family alpha-L-glutamate ligase [Methanocella arvoryzae]CAJ36379.1 30S ribosomal protein S6 modification protein [Methanocella arvoryzae MRE50]